MNREKEIEDLVNKIKNIKEGHIKISSTDLEELKHNLSLDEIQEKMEILNKTIIEILGVERYSIAEHIDFYLKKSKRFDDPKYERLFLGEQKPIKSSRNTSKMIDYSIRDKLIGFLPKRRSLRWDDKKINEFFNSIKSSNQ